MSAPEERVGGFFIVLEDGSAVGIHPERHPQTALGTDMSGKILYLLVIDGCGSTTITLGNDGQVVLGNVPIYNGIPGNQRAVGTCLGLRIRP